MYYNNRIGGINMHTLTTHARQTARPRTTQTLMSQHVQSHLNRHSKMAVQTSPQPLTT